MRDTTRVGGVVAAEAPAGGAPGDSGTEHRVATTTSAAVPPPAELAGREIVAWALALALSAACVALFLTARRRGSDLRSRDRQLDQMRDELAALEKERHRLTAKVQAGEQERRAVGEQLERVAGERQTLEDELAGWQDRTRDVAEAITRSARSATPVRAHTPLVAGHPTGSSRRAGDEQEAPPVAGANDRDADAGPPEQRWDVRAPSAPPAVFAQHDAIRVLAEWCRAGRFPEHALPLERSHVRLTGPATTGRAVPQTLEDTRQLSEFTRLGVPHAGDAWLVPNPDARFTPLVALLFPGLEEDWEQRPSLYERLAPLRVVRRDGGLWELAR